jgi:hypothetical protein
VNVSVNMSIDVNVDVGLSVGLGVTGRAVVSIDKSGYGRERYRESGRERRPASPYLQTGTRAPPRPRAESRL